MFLPWWLLAYKKRWARVAMARSASHFRARGSWHRMLWPENLTAQECCACVLRLCSPHKPGRELSVLEADCEHPQASDTPSLTVVHTGSLVTSRHSSPSQNPMTHFSGPDYSSSLTTPDCTYLLHSGLELYILTNTQTWGPGHPRGPTTISVFSEVLGLHTCSSLAHLNISA